jgi:hypothetical protein
MAEESIDITTTDRELQAVLMRYFGGFLRERGQILYSGIDTLRPGPFYFLGFNPAKDGTNPLLSDVRLDRTEWSAYTKQCWYCPLSPRGCANGCAKAGKKPHQKQVVRIMSELELVPEKTFATNLIFVESKTTAEMVIHDSRLLDSCWCVHQKMLAVVKPSYIVCLGNGEKPIVSVFRTLGGIAHDQKEMRASGRFKSFVGTFHLNEAPPLTATVIGVPHPSYPPWNSTGLRGFIGI